jgi:hypothetical protein
VTILVALSAAGVAAMVRGRAEHAERGARAAEQAEAGQHERTDEQDARRRSE